MRNLYFLLIFIFLGCVKNPSNPSDPNTPVDHDRLFIEFTEDQLNWVFDSRDTTYLISDPIPKLTFEGNPVEIRKIKTRGNSASRVRRKSFSIDTYEKIFLENEENNTTTKTKDFRLIALSSDFCYIENRIGFGLLQSAELFPLFFKYTEVLLNQETNGVYLLFENPNDYFLDKNDHAICIRRGYFGKIDSYKYQDNGDGFSEQDYVDTFNEIYDIIKDYEGKELFERLEEVLNVRDYMRKIAFDYLIQNGDYTDEIYLYDVPGDNKIQYNIIPWDLDDIFATNPHEIGNAWGTGNIFGDRYYETREEVIAAIGDKLIYSIEDDLDFAIARDEYTYGIYLEELEKLLNTITENDIRMEFDRIERELESFFEISTIVDQTEYDASPCSPQKLKNEIVDKENFLINRRRDILDKL